MNMIEKICLKGYEKHILLKLTAILSKNPMKNIRKYIFNNDLFLGKNSYIWKKKCKD